MGLLRIALLLGVVLPAVCESKKEDPAIDVCQVNIDCTLVQLDACCNRSTCDSDLRAETVGRTRERLATCAKKDCVKSTAPCQPTRARVGSFCREGHCKVEILP